MKRIKEGDLFEIKTIKGNVYLHFLFKDKEIGELIRVLPNFYLNQPSEFDSLVKEKEKFMIFFPLSFALKKKFVSYIGNYSLKEFKKPQFMRSEYNVRGEFLGWHIINTDTWERQLVNSLTLEQKKLSPWGVWNYELLLEKLENDFSLNSWG